MSASGSPFRRLSPEFTGALAYLFGALSGIVMLMVEKEDRFVRFHAMQSTVTFIVVLVAHLALSGIPVFGRLFYYPFVMGVVGLWCLLMYQALQGRRYKLPYLGDFVEHQLR